MVQQIRKSIITVTIALVLPKNHYSKILSSLIVFCQTRLAKIKQPSANIPAGCTNWTRRVGGATGRRERAREEVQVSVKGVLGMDMAKIHCLQVGNCPRIKKQKDS